MAVMMLFSLTGCADILGGALFLLLIASGDDRVDKDGIFEFVFDNEKELLNAIENNDFSVFENAGPIIGTDADDAVVDFYCGGAGMGPSTSYVGFYYTPCNDMTAIWCAPSSANSLILCGNGFE